MTDDRGLTEVIRALQTTPIPSLDMYKEKCLRRRLAVRMRARGIESLSEYATVLRNDPGEREVLLYTLTINVTQFFRNPEVWDALADPVCERFSSSARPVRCWSAGCATGQEPYTFAMLVAEQEARLGARWLERCHIDATDVDDKVLEAARDGQYPEMMFGIPVPERARPFVSSVSASGGDPLVEVVSRVRRAVRFSRHDLGRDPPPQPPYDFILCRNVVIYFERDVQEDLFMRFAEALAVGGYLLLGKVEGIIGAARSHLIPVDLRARLYRRAA